MRSDLAGQLKQWVLTEMTKAQETSASAANAATASGAVSSLEQGVDDDDDNSNDEDEEADEARRPFADGDVPGVRSQPPACGSRETRRADPCDDDNPLAAIRESRKVAKDISAIWRRNEQLVRKN
jgi:hypothetical protein